MTRHGHVSDHTDEYGGCFGDVSAVVDTNSRLPDWPFRLPSGRVSICEFDRLLGAGFAPVLEALSADHGDESVSLLVLEPEPSYYRTEYSYLPCFRVDRGALSHGYWAGLSHEPQGDPTGAIAYTANVVALVGSTRAWAIWGQRDWDVALVLSRAEGGSWLRAGVPFVGAREALAEFRAPKGWGKLLTEAEIVTFLGNVEQRGSGPE